MSRRTGSIAIGVLTFTILGVGWWWHARLGYRGVDHWAAVAQGRTHLRQNRPDLALQAVIEIRDEGPGAGEAMTIAGLALGRYGQLHDARLALDRALRLQPDQLEAARALAELEMRIGNGAGATRALEMATRLDPNDFRLWHALGKVYHDRADSPNAARAFEKAAILKPNDVEALTGLIRELLNSHQVEEAASWLAKASSALPGNPAIMGLDARLFCELGRYEEAIARADRSLAEAPDDASALLARGRARIALSRWEQALGDLERAASVLPDNLNTLSLVLLVETHLGLTERAEATRKKRLETQERVQLMGRLTKDMEEHPDDPELRWHLGKAAVEGGATVLGRRCFEAALALDPAYQPARDSLAALLESQPVEAPAPLISHSRRPPPLFPVGISLSFP